MPVIEVRQKGNFLKTEHWLKKLHDAQFLKHLERYGELGVQALSENTPRDTGLTAASWGYEIEVGTDTAKITWTNSNVVDGWFNVAIMLQYGHGTGSGGYVHGIDYINPAMQSVFVKIVEDMWMEVMSIS